MSRRSSRRMPRHLLALLYEPRGAPPRLLCPSSIPRPLPVSRLLARRARYNHVTASSGSFAFSLPLPTWRPQVSERPSAAKDQAPKRLSEPDPLILRSRGVGGTSSLRILGLRQAGGWAIIGYCLGMFGGRGRISHYRLSRVPSTKVSVFRMYLALSHPELFIKNQCREKSTGFGYCWTLSLCL